MNYAFYISKQVFRRKAKGHASMELAASLMFILPLVFVILFVVVEMVKGYAITGVLTQAATQTARQLAVLYPDNPSLTSRGAQDYLVYNNVSYGGVIVNSGQFDDAVFNTSVSPPTVTVTVRYLGGKYGLDPFPTYDPLHLGGNFKLSSTAVYRLESN